MWATRVATALLAAGVVAKLAAVVWALDRGFEIGDEGVFLLSLNDPGSAPPNFAFYRLLELLEPRPHFDVLTARVIRVGVELGATILLAASVLRWARRGPLVGASVRALPFYLLSLTGALLSVGSRSVSYNDITNLCLFSAAGCFFLLATAGTSMPARHGAAVLMGLLVGFQLFVKWPAGVLAAAVLAAATGLCLPSLAGRRRVGLLCSFSAGVGGAVVAFAGATGGWQALVLRVEYARELDRLTGYSVTGILAGYVFHDLYTYVGLAVAVVGCGLLREVVHRLWPAGAHERSAHADGVLAVSVVGAVALVSATSWRLHPPFVHPSLIVLYCSTVLVAGLLLAVSIREVPGQRAGASASSVEMFAPLFLLAMLPFLIVVGTNVAPTLKLPSHIAPLFVLVAVGVSMPGVRAGYPRLCAVVPIVLVVVTSLGFVANHIRRPYGLPAPIVEQDHPVAGLPGMKVDAATARFLERLERTTRGAGLRAGDPVIAFDYMAGLVHYLGATSPGFPFYRTANPELNCFLINRADHSVAPFVLIAEPLGDAQRECIDAFDFPGDFERVGAIANPYEDVYPAFFDGNKLPLVFVYAPRARAGEGANDGDQAATGRVQP